MPCCSKIGRRRAKEAAHGEQTPLDQRLGNGRENLEGDVEAFFDRVDNTVVDDDIELDAWVAPIEFGQRRAEVAEREARQHLDAQAAGGGGPQLAHLVRQFVDAADHLGALAIERLAHFG